MWWAIMLFSNRARKLMDQSMLMLSTYPRRENTGMLSIFVFLWCPQMSAGPYIHQTMWHLKKKICAGYLMLRIAPIRCKKKLEFWHGNVKVQLFWHRVWAILNRSLYSNQSPPQVFLCRDLGSPIGGWWCNVCCKGNTDVKCLYIYFFLSPTGSIWIEKVDSTDHWTSLLERRNESHTTINNRNKPLMAAPLHERNWLCASILLFVFFLFS